MTKSLYQQIIESHRARQRAHEEARARERGQREVLWSRLESDLFLYLGAGFRKQVQVAPLLDLSVAEVRLFDDQNRPPIASARLSCHAGTGGALFVGIGDSEGTMPAEINDDVRAISKAVAAAFLAP